MTVYYASSLQEAVQDIANRGVIMPTYIFAPQPNDGQTFHLSPDDRRYLIVNAPRIVRTRNAFTTRYRRYQFARRFLAAKNNRGKR